MQERQRDRTEEMNIQRQKASRDDEMERNKERSKERTQERKQDRQQEAKSREIPKERDTKRKA